LSIDTRANVERPEGERPVRIAPPLPDVESTAPHWYGSATSHLRRWQVRAESAEALVGELRRALGRYRYRP
jgi:hypothetical protein